jgi:hypothetical protein
MSTASLFTGLEDLSTDVGYSITMRLRKTMMKAATGSVRTHSARVNMSPFAARKARCTPSRLRPSNPFRDSCPNLEGARVY